MNMTFDVVAGVLLVGVIAFLIWALVRFWDEAR